MKKTIKFWLVLWGIMVGASIGIVLLIKGMFKLGMYILTKYGNTGYWLLFGSFSVISLGVYSFFLAKRMAKQ